MPRRGPTLDHSAVQATAQSIQSYKINNNNSLQLRAFLIKDSGVYTCDGSRQFGHISKEDVDESSKRRVGRGTSGQLYWAKLKDGSHVALKEIPITSKSHRDEVDRELSFFSSRSDCPFVMSNLGAFWDAQETAIVIGMEWMAYTLSDISRFWNGIEEGILRDIFFQVVSGLHYLHCVKRVIHRDIKPSNILIRADGYVKIGDFGISKLVETLDISSTYVGTMQFMAPERLEDTAYSFSSDVWSLGLTVISTVTGHNPWAPPDEMNIFQLLNRIAGDSTPTLPSSQSFSVDAHDFVAQCLQRDAEKRPSCAELLRHPFLRDCNEQGAVENVRQMVQYMTRLIETSAKKHAAVHRDGGDVEQEVHAKIDRIGQL